MPQTLGYARVSTPDQDITGQLMRLADAGAARSYQDVASGRVTERSGLAALLDYARTGDTLMVVRLDRLGRSLRELLTTVDDLKGRGVALVSLEWPAPNGGSSSYVSGRRARGPSCSRVSWAARVRGR